MVITATLDKISIIIINFNYYSFITLRFNHNFEGMTTHYQGL